MHTRAVSRTIVLVAAVAALASSSMPRVQAAVESGGLNHDKSRDFVSYVPPSDELVYQIARERAGPGASPAAVEAAALSERADWSARHEHGPRPDDAARLMVQELNRLSEPAGARTAQDEPETLRVLAIPVEFAGSDSVEDFSFENGIRTGVCITATTTFTGPLHNEIPAPSPRDNNSLWMPEFESDFYDKIIFSTEGVTERPRLDMIDPVDGEPGIDISRLTMANYYDEVSSGQLKFDKGPAGVVDWVPVPHSVAYYGANPCQGGRVRGSGLPGNQGGTATLLQDMADVINERDPDFPWDYYDEDQNGVIDHIQVFHAGIDESEGGGREGTHQIWAHRGTANAVVDDRGTEDTADDLRIRGYTIQPENLNLGVLVHEFGHDLGIFDLYTTTGENNVVWWDLMSTGSHPGRLKGTDPTHMSAHTKFALGWLDLPPLGVTDDPVERTLGQAAQPPEGTTRALRVDLPPTEVRMVTLPAGSAQAWWSGNDQDRANNRLVRTVDLTAVTGPVQLRFDWNFVAERDYDYFAVEVSTDGGSSWSQIKGFNDATGDEITTPDDYADPNDALAEYGMRNAYTGSSRGWVRARHELTPYAGQSIQLALRGVSDANTLERGAYADNFAITAGGQEVFADTVEGGDPHGWASVPGTFGGSMGAGWRFSEGIVLTPRYYVLEWRNTVGFDTGLQWTYNTVYSGVTADGGREFIVDKVPSNVPGMLVWLRDIRYDSSQDRPSNSVLSTARYPQMPSEGPKGGLLLIDANYEPLRGPLGGRVTNQWGSWPYPPDDNWNGRVQTSNAAFALRDSPALQLSAGTGWDVPDTTVITTTDYASLPAKTAFHDSMGYFAGVELLPEPITVMADETDTRIKRYTFADVDGSTVVPASAYYSPRTPEGFTGMGAETSPPSASVSSQETMYLVGEQRPLGDPRGPLDDRQIVSLSLGEVAGQDVTGEQSGNPGDALLQLGFHFEILDEAADGSWGRIRLWRQMDAADAGGLVRGQSDSYLVMVAATNTGGAYDLVVHSALPEGVQLLADSMTGGAVPVAASPAELAAAVATGGPEALAALAVPAAAANGVAWAGAVPTGEQATFEYETDKPSGPSTSLRWVNAVYGPSYELGDLDHVELNVSWLGSVLLPALKNE